MKKELTNILLTITASAISAVTLHVLVLGNAFAPSGIDGIAAMLQELTKISAGIYTFLLNLPLLIVALFILKRKYVLYTILFTALSSLWLFLLGKFNFYQYVTNTDRIIVAIFSGLLLGIRTGIMLRIGASSGGIDIIACVVQVKYNRDVEKVISFLFLVPSSMLSTVSALGAQNIGAGKPERAVQTLRYAMLITVSFGVVAAISVQFLAQSIVGLFTPDDAVIHAGGQYLRGYIWDCIFAGIHFSFSGYFCACGKSGISFLHNLSSIVLVRIPGVYWTSKHFADTLFPMGLATTAGSLLSVAICITASLLLSRSRRTEQVGG